MTLSALYPGEKEAQGQLTGLQLSQDLNPDSQIPELYPYAFFFFFSSGMLHNSLNSLLFQSPFGYKYKEAQVEYRPLQNPHDCSVLELRFEPPPV